MVGVLLIQREQDPNDIVLRQLFARFQSTAYRALDDRSGGRVAPEWDNNRKSLRTAYRHAVHNERSQVVPAQSIHPRAIVELLLPERLVAAA